MTEESTDGRLRDAGRRLRDNAPSAAATETALDLLDDRRAAPSRVRWIAPLAFAAAAAAAVVGVLVLTRPDESGRVVPAETSSVPATSAAPVTSILPPTTVPAATAPATTSTSTTSTTTTSTSTSTTTATTLPPPGGPAFVGDLPLDASAAIVGCPGTFGDLAAAVDDPRPIAWLACAGDYAVATAIGWPDGATYELRWDGDWTQLGYGTSYPCDVPDDICAAFDNPSELGDAARPLPPAWIVEDPNFLPGVDAAETLAGLDVAVTGDTAAFATALGEALQAIIPGDPVPGVETAVLDDVPVVAVTLTGIPDDSSSRHVYVVRYADRDGTLTPLDGLGFTYCNRAVTTDGLCL